MAAVEAPLSPAEPTARIIHLLDWHFVPRDLLAADVRSAAGKPLSYLEVDDLHAEHLRAVEAIQSEQVSLLRRLAQRRGLRSVFVEGLTSDGLKAY